MDEPGACEALPVAVVGLLYRLTRAAWHETPPCTLPDDAAVLAHLAGTARTDKFDAALATVRERWACDPHTGRLVLPAAQRLYTSLMQAQTQRREKAAAAARGRWGGERCSEHSGEQCPKHCSEHPAGAVRPVFSTPERSTQREKERALNPERSGAGVVASIGPGTAKAIVDQERLEFVGEMLTTAHWPWTPDLKQRRIPARMARELQYHQDATPERVAYVLSEIQARHEKALTGEAKDYDRPIGVVIAALGAHRECIKQPWGVPLAFLPEFEAKFKAWKAQRPAVRPPSIPFTRTTTPARAATKEQTA